MVARIFQILSVTSQNKYLMCLFLTKKCIVDYCFKITIILLPDYCSLLSYLYILRKSLFLMSNIYFIFKSLQILNTHFIFFINLMHLCSNKNLCLYLFLYLESNIKLLWMIIKNIIHSLNRIYSIITIYRHFDKYILYAKVYSVGKN